MNQMYWEIKHWRQHLSDRFVVVLTLALILTGVVGFLAIVEMIEGVM